MPQTSVTTQPNFGVIAMDDDMLSNSYGALVFFFNAGFLLLYGALAIIANLKPARRARSISAQAYWAAR
jgi:hypothetical protein